MNDVGRLLFNKETRKLELLTTPVNRLGLDLKSSPLQAPIDNHLARLKRRGIKLKPHFYLGEDWGCVSGTANIEIGFYDADPLLKELNKEVRGCLNDSRLVDYLLRHETGHAFCYAHRLYRNREFRKVFGIRGNFFDSYPTSEHFKVHPWSRDYVNPNRDHYAQKHPDEDFAETFVVWLSLPSNWRRAYKNKRKALGKLEFVARLVSHYGDKAPQVPLDPGDVDAPVESLKTTVAEVLGASLSKYRARATGYIDPLLKKIGRYRTGRPDSGTILLAELIGAHRRFIVDALVRDAHITPSQALSLIDKMQERSKALQLSVPISLMDKKLIDIVSLASTLATHFAVDGRLLPEG
jgi:hypothetical protein